MPVLDHCNQVIGVLQAVGEDGRRARGVADARERRFTEHDARFLALFCSQLASAIEHISLTSHAEQAPIVARCRTTPRPFPTLRCTDGAA